MSPGSSAAWQVLTGRSPADIILSNKVIFTIGDILASFAIIKRLGREVNYAMQGGMPSVAWARVIVEDHASETDKIRNSSGWMRALRGFRRHKYGAVSLTLEELESTAISLGIWDSRKGAASQKVKGGSSC
jgi:hypothetical protein